MTCKRLAGRRRLLETISQPRGDSSDRGDPDPTAGSSATPESIGETVDQLTDRTLGQRPDLMEQVANIRSATARVKEEGGILSCIERQRYAEVTFALRHAAAESMANLTGGVNFNFNWTIFDGGVRKNRLAEARPCSRNRGASNVKRNQIPDEISTAYSNLIVSFRQRQAALALPQGSIPSYDAALEFYHGGVRNLLDGTAAQRTLAEARSTDVLARAQVLTSLANLVFTAGDSIRANNARPGP